MHIQKVLAQSRIPLNQWGSMRLLISMLSVVFVVSITPTSEAGDGPLIQNLALKQSKRVTDEINELRNFRKRQGPCTAMSGTLLSTCKNSKQGSRVVIAPTHKYSQDLVEGPITIQALRFFNRQ